VELDYNN
jgi:hypothetical protein